MSRLIVLLCALLPVSAIQAQDKPPAKDPAAQLRSLMEERRDTLDKAVQVLLAQYRVGTVDVERLASAMSRLGEAELDFAKNKDERIAVCRKQVEVCRDFEKICQGRRDAGTVTDADVLQAKAERLKAEIQLLREQGSPDAAK
jgi:hypothetical protein